MNYAAIISYDGSKYYGFQRLNDLPTVQKEIEKSLSLLMKSEITIKGAGRTDRGVHANYQVINFYLNRKFELSKLKKIMNDYLPKSIRFLKCVYVDESFHSRFCVLQKTYIYKIYQGRENPFIDDYAYDFDKKINILTMKKAAKKMIGIHDFHNFVSGTREKSNSIIYKINISKKGDYIIIKFIGKSFYRYMVRNMVGCLLEVGLGNKKIDYIDEMFSNKNITPFTVPPNGLYLENIKYDKKYKLN